MRGIPSAAPTNQITRFPGAREFKFLLIDVLVTTNEWKMAENERETGRSWRHPSPLLPATALKTAVRGELDRRGLTAYRNIRPPVGRVSLQAIKHSKKVVSLSLSRLSLSSSSHSARPLLRAAALAWP